MTTVPAIVEPTEPPLAEQAIVGLERDIDDLSHLYATDPDARDRIEAEAVSLFECHRRLSNLVEQVRPALAKTLGAQAA